jgi:hypothetical protein
MEPEKTAAEAPRPAAANEIASSAPRTGRILLCLVAAAIVASPAAWLLVEKFQNHFEIPPEAKAGISVVPTPEQQARLSVAGRIRDRKNLALTFALVGSVLGLALGAAAGFARGSMTKAAVGLVVGAAAGAVSGALGGAAAAWVAEQMKSVPIDAEYQSLLAEVAGFAILGLGPGLAASVVVRGGRGAAGGALAGFYGGLIGGALMYPMLWVAVILVPDIDAASVIPQPAIARFLWTIAAALPIALAAGLAAGRKTAPRVT